MTKSQSHRILHHRILFTALVMGLLSIPITRYPVRAQAIDAPEFTPQCDECVAKISWDSSGGADYYELFLVDPLHPDGRRRIYKGTSDSVYVTVRGAETALVRACNRPSSCSGTFEIPLIPDVPSGAGLRKDFRLTEPIQLVHESYEEFTEPAVGWPARKFRALLVDITATGQRVCQKESSEAIWSVGTRMKVSVADDIEFIARNREVVEHKDGSWTWFGDLDGGHQGTLTLTTDRCGESVYMSIDSDAGQFVVQPDAAPIHVAYEVIAGDRLRGCHAAPSTEAVALFDVVDTPTVDVPRSGKKSALRSRSVSIDIVEILDRFSSLAYLVGDDRSYDVARFLATATNIELLPGVPVPLDLHHGEFLSSSPGIWVWHGCVAGDPDSKASISVNALRQTVELRIEQGNRLVLLKPDRSGQYYVSEYAL